MDATTQPTRTRVRRAEAFRRELVSWVKCLTITLMAALLIRMFVFTMIRVDGISMLETLKDADRLVVTIADLKITGPRRGDVVICTYPGADHMCVKRVMGLPGETLELRGGSLFIDGEIVDEPYLTRGSGANYGPVTVPEGEYFVMGDNRPDSKDSRSAQVGTLPLRSIHGRARFIVWPPERFGGLNP